MPRSAVSRRAAALALAGLGLLPLVTVFDLDKTVRHTQTKFELAVAGSTAWAALAGVPVSGYEIHHGQTAQHPAMAAAGDVARAVLPDGLGWCNAAGHVMGVYLHGLFEDPAVLHALLLDESERRLRAHRGEGAGVAAERRAHGIAEIDIVHVRLRSVGWRAAQAPGATEIGTDSGTSSVPWSASPAILRAVARAIRPRPTRPRPSSAHPDARGDDSLPATTHPQPALGPGAATPPSTLPCAPRRPRSGPG